MSITYADKFYGTDWERYSLIAGKSSPVVLAILGGLCVFLGYGLASSFYLYLVALILAVVEHQALSWCSQIDSIRNKIYETLNLESNISKAVSFGVLSVYCYYGNILNVLGGIFLDMTGLFYLFAWMNIRHDQQANQNANSFGTF